MPVDVEIKLLELTRTRQRIALNEVAEEMYVRPSTLARSLENLSGDLAVPYGSDVIEVDTNQRISIAEKLIHHGRDPERIARCLMWQEFENFASDSLTENGFHSVRHFVFKANGTRREVDILAWNDNFLFAIDCKHWAKTNQPSRMRSAVLAQIERSAVLAGRPELLRRIGLPKIEGRSIMPAMVTLGEPRVNSIERVPIIAVSKLVSFLYGISPRDESFLQIAVKSPGITLLNAGLPKS